MYEQSDILYKPTIIRFFTKKQFMEFQLIFEAVLNFVNVPRTGKVGALRTTFLQKSVTQRRKVFAGGQFAFYHLI